MFFIKNKKPINVYADDATRKYLLKNFSYCFKSNSKEYPSILKLNRIKNIFSINKSGKKISIRSIKVEHGKVNSICYIINKKLAYISDVSKIYKKDYKYFKNLKYLIIDCLWYRRHTSHLNFEQSLELIKKFSPRKAILTNLHSDLDYKELKKKLNKNITPAYDGMCLNL